MPDMDDSAETVPILVVPDPMLKARARPVGREDFEQVRSLVPRMFATMYRAPGIGLAAPQVGIGLRFAVVDLQPDDNRAPIVLINPEVIARSEEMVTREEGCLSLPGQYADVTRPARVTVRYTDIEGARQPNRGGWATFGLLAARDRPSGRDPVRRPPLGAEAQHDPAPACQGTAAEARRGDVVAMRLAFMGSPEFAIPALRALHAAGHEIAAVYCQPPKPAGRGYAVRPCPVQVEAERLDSASPDAGAAAPQPEASRRRSPHSVWTPPWWRPTG